MDPSEGGAWRLRVMAVGVAVVRETRKGMKDPDGQWVRMEPSHCATDGTVEWIGRVHYVGVAYSQTSRSRLNLCDDAASLTVTVTSLCSPWIRI